MTEKLREDHEEDCCKFKAQKVYMPHEVPVKPHKKMPHVRKDPLKLSFDSYRKTVKHPFVISKLNGLVIK